MNLFHMLYRRKARPGGQVVLECFDTLRRPFSQSFNAAVVEILNKADNLMTRRGPLRKEAKAHPLHVASDEKSARYFTGHLSNHAPLAARG